MQFLKRHSHSTLKFVEGSSWMSLLLGVWVMENI
jgi:hypothetical protein